MYLPLPNHLLTKTAVGSVSYKRMLSCYWAADPHGDIIMWLGSTVTGEAQQEQKQQHYHQENQQHLQRLPLDLEKQQHQEQQLHLKT